MNSQLHFAECAFAQSLSEDVMAESGALGMRIMSVGVVLAVRSLICAMPLAFPGVVVSGLVAC